MNRPESIVPYEERDLKLGIKSSLPHIKGTVALMLLFWECADQPASLIYAKQSGDEIELTDELQGKVISYLSDLLSTENLDETKLLNAINQNQLFKSQLEALIVAFELVWKLAKITFVSEKLPSSAERTEGIRYPKKLDYSVNLDIIHNAMSANQKEYVKLLLSWIGIGISFDKECEERLTRVLTALSEGAIFKLTDGNKDVIFNQNCVYEKLIETSEAVDINGDKEAKGPLRILKSLLSEGMNPYLVYNNGNVTIAPTNADKIEQYQKRVETLLRLFATKVIGLDDSSDDKTSIEQRILECWNNKAFNYQEVEHLYSDFKNRFGKEAISKLEGHDLLYTLFGKKADNSLMYCLENQSEYFGGITGYRWHLFLYQKDEQWISSTNQHGVAINEERAIELAVEYRDKFVKLFEYIENGLKNGQFASLDGFNDLLSTLKSMLGEAFSKRQWVRKYLHMLYPSLFINTYTDTWVNKIFRVAQIVPEKNYYLCCGQFSLFARKLGIPNVYLYHILETLDDAEGDAQVVGDGDEGIGAELELSHEIDESLRLTVGKNVLLYGVPGSGKSWTIEHEYVKSTSKVERLVFHPDYTYSDFVGQILPCVDDEGQVSYKFTPGPFTNILRDAYLHPQDEYILVIEEINRGNAPAIFGEIFQLLDRKVDDEGSSNSYPIGTSEYGITNGNIAQIVYGDPTHKVRIPSNLSIIGTMNTSDQNVFTLDTAFQRRWQMRLIENNFENVDPSFANMPILDTTVTWEKFCTEINKIIVGNGARTTSSEDKRLGAYFIHKRDLAFDDKMGDLKDGTYDALRKKESAETITEEEKEQLAIIRSAMMQNRRFPEKVIKYLWDDAFKFNREAVFDVGAYQSLEDVIRAFLYSLGRDRMNIFSESVRGAIFNTEA